MFGLLQKMDRFSNKLMSREENIDFIQEIVDNGMVWKMHNKYIDEALFLMGQGKVVDMVLRRVIDNDAPRQEKNPEPVVTAKRPSSPFWRSICY